MARNPPGRRLRDIVSTYAEQIHRGDLPPGTRLPPERRLAERLGVNRATVALAYAELVARGLVERRRGSGTLVRGDLWGVAPDWPRYLAGSAFQPTRPLRQRLREIQRQPGVLDLAQGSIGPDLFPRAALEAILRDLRLPEEMDYPDPLGDEGLRRAIAAEHARQHGVRVEPDRVLVTNGGQQAVDLITRVLLGPGDAIAIEQPSYYYSLTLFQAAGIRLLPAPVDAEGIDPEGLAALVQRQGVRLALLNPTYQNPTTTCLSLTRRTRLLAVCRGLNIPVVEENGYGLLHLDGPPPPALHALDGDGRVLYLGTVSKVLAPGLRLGWLIGPRPVIARLAEARQQIDFGMAGLNQALVARFLTSPAWPAHLERVRSALRRRRDALADALRATLGAAMRLDHPAGGLHLWARWEQRGDDRAGLEAAARAGVAYLPGRLYGAPDGFLRLTFATLAEAEATIAAQRLSSLGRPA
jgi:GntR family transcriptional regulator, regulator for abcA and norABC